MHHRPAIATVAMLLAIGMIGACGAPKDSTASSAPNDGDSSLRWEKPKNKKTADNTSCQIGQWDPARPEHAPTVAWNYQEQTLWPYPTSDELGPYLTDSDGYRHCYAHSSSGALLAAANIAAMMTSPTLMTDADSVVKLFGHGSQYETIKEKLQSETLKNDSDSGVRAELYGFRILESQETTAIVDLGYQASADGRSINLSIVYNLVWDDGDWKLQSEDTVPVTSATLSSFVNYMPWRET